VRFVAVHVQEERHVALLAHDIDQDPRKFLVAAIGKPRARVRVDEAIEAVEEAEDGQNVGVGPNFNGEPASLAKSLLHAWHPGRESVLAIENAVWRRTSPGQNRGNRRSRPQRTRCSLFVDECVAREFFEGRRQRGLDARGRRDEGRPVVAERIDDVHDDPGAPLARRQEKRIRKPGFRAGVPRANRERRTTPRAARQVEREFAPSIVGADVGAVVAEAQRRLCSARLAANGTTRRRAADGASGGRQTSRAVPPDAETAGRASSANSASSGACAPARRIRSTRSCAGAVGISAVPLAGGEESEQRTSKTTSVSACKLRCRTGMGINAKSLIGALQRGLIPRRRDRTAVGQGSLRAPNGPRRVRAFHRRTVERYSMYSVCFYVPETHIEEVKRAFFDAGGHVRRFNLASRLFVEPTGVAYFSRCSMRTGTCGYEAQAGFWRHVQVGMGWQVPAGARRRAHQQQAAL